MDGRLDWVTTSRDSPERASLLGSLAAVSCQSLAPLLGSAFDACENVFLELANNASSTYDEQRLLEFRRELSAKKSAVMADFAARITTELTRLRQPEPGDAAALELVAQEQIERQLLVSGGVSRVRNEWRSALEQLHERMLAIAPRDFSAQDNPLEHMVRLVQAHGWFVTALALLLGAPAVTHAANELSVSQTLVQFPDTAVGSTSSSIDWSAGFQVETSASRTR